MEKLTIKRIKLNFKNDHDLVELGDVIKNEIEELKSSYPEWNHKIDRNLITITGEYLYLTFISNEKNKSKIY